MLYEKMVSTIATGRSDRVRNLVTLRNKIDVQRDLGLAGLDKSTTNLVFDILRGFKAGQDILNRPGRM
jgi:hypothetical protein